MRKITEESIEAFNKNENFVKSNTEVITDNHTTMLKIFGNTIAIKNIDTKEVKITNCGHKTNTTKERLNSIAGVSIRQSDGDWLLNGKEWDGELISINKK